MAVVVLLSVYQYAALGQWLVRFFFLYALTIATLVLVKLIPDEMLGSWWFQAGLFLGDTAVATTATRWRDPNSQVYLIYFLIIFGTALTRSYKQSVALGLITSTLFLLVGWSPAHGFPHDAAFWLRFELLIVTTCLLAILAQDSQRTQAEQDRRYHQRVVQVERLSSLGQLAAEVAHRIKGPLTTIMVNAEVLQHRYARSKEASKELAEIQEEVGRCKHILKHLLDLGRIEEMDLAPLDLFEPLKHALKAIEAQARRKKVKLVARVQGPLRALGDQSLLQEAFSAVLQNAVDAVEPGGRVRVTAEESDGRWIVDIEDDGCGITSSGLERLFEPFYTTKGADGSGLGLPAALRIMQKHSGSIEGSSAGAGRGARFTFSIPKAPQGAARG